jgi:signal transduction histidine kinase
MARSHGWHKRRRRASVDDDSPVFAATVGPADSGYPDVPMSELAQLRSELRGWAGDALLSHGRMRSQIRDNDAESAERLMAGLRADRARIACDLHDSVIQELFAVGMGLTNLASLIPEHAQRIDSYAESLDEVIHAIRATIFQLETERRDQAGVKSRVMSVVTQHTDQLGFAPHVRFKGPADLSVDQTLADDIIAVTREALSNVARHARASAVQIILEVRDGDVTLQINDNGIGTSLGEQTRSSGLANMRQRAGRHRGTLRLSRRQSGGTQLTWTAASDRDGSDANPTQPTAAA